MKKPKVILISGGTGGLGQAVTTAFLETGADVLTTYRREEEFRDLESTVDHRERLQGFAVDLTDEKAVDGLFKEIKKQHGRLDVFCHLMGGFWMGKDVFETPVDRWDKMMALNLRSTFLCTRGAFRLMRTTGGHIFTISARPALELPAGMGAYAVSKAGVLHLTEILAKEGRSSNIHANSILPGIIDTPANREAMPDADFNDWMKPETIAGMLVALSRKPAGVSGSAIRMYGKT